jgi:hypothetical protein
MKFSEIINDQQLATEAIRRWITMAICIVMAILSAFWIVNQQFFMFGILAAVAVMIFVTVGMQRNAWLLILVGWFLEGGIHALPVPLATRDIVILFVTCSYIAQRVVGQTPQQSGGALGALAVINCGYIAFTFLCHPVGIRALGAETMGGRTYFTIFISLCAYWVIVHLPESYKSVTKIPIWLLVSASFSALICAIVYIFPSITPYIWFFYGGIDISAYLGSLNAAESEPELRRLFALAPFGVILIQTLSAYYPPRKILSPARWQFYLFALGFAVILASGFRNFLAIALGSLALAAWFHSGWRGVVVGGTIGGALLVLLIFGQGRFFDLPLTAQRALGSLPGKWDESIKEQVKISNARLDWWRQVIEEGTVVNNWWIGDGFGVSERDFASIAGGKVAFNDAATITGSFHNGPLTTIRAAGVFGLILFYALMIAAAVSSVRCVRRCRGTPLLSAAIFLAIQLVWTPVHFTFLFGDYSSQLPEHMFLVGLLILVRRMSERQPPSTEPAVLARPLLWNNGAIRVST